MTVHRSSQNFDQLFVDGSEVVGVDRDYAEMYLDNNATAQTIETANTPICCRHFTAGELADWTYGAGSTGAITAYSDATGGQVNVASLAHGLSNGDIISIRGTTNYNGVFEVTYVDADNFEITVTWVADDGASDWDSPDYLETGAGAAGDYQIDYSLGVKEGGAAGSTALFAIYSNATDFTKTTMIRKFSNNDVGSLSGSGIVSVVAGDRVFLAVESTGTNTITLQYGNVVLRRL